MAISIPSGSTVVPTEFESTISIKIEKEEYERATGKIDIIFFFKDSSRLNCRRVEKKVIVCAKNVFGFHEGYVYPIRRTVAHETLCRADKFLEVVKCTHRKVTRLENGVRVSYNKEECGNGVLYTIEYEIEYAADADYDEIVRNERLLMTEATRNNHFTNTTEMSLENIFACVMTKVQMWHCFDDRQPYLWAYKWDGMKAKMIVHDDTSKVYLWRDADNIRIVPFRGYHEFMKNLCMVVEILDDVIVIIEIIGSRFSDNRVYLSEPATNIQMLDHMRTLMYSDSKPGTTTMYVDGKPLVPQNFYRSEDEPMPEYQPNDNYDGFILVQNNMVIKWKMPTVDVKCVSKRLYSVADKTFELDREGEKDAIYEISPNYKIIRKRIDRITSSTEQEYAMFIESVKMLSHAKLPFFIDK